MAISQARSRRKITGGFYKNYRKKRLYELGNLPRLTKLGNKKLRKIKNKFNIFKNTLLQADEANVYNPETKKYVKTKIITIVDNPANRHFIRRNIITKGAIIKTELGNARITSRPGQHGIINAILIKEEKKS